MKNLRTATELSSSAASASIFQASPHSIEQKLENFPKYVRRQDLKRFLALYEIFKLIVPVKGSVFECGVFHGFGFMSWAKLSAILEPENFTRRIYGFDSFMGFPAVGPKDSTTKTPGDSAGPSPGDLCCDSKDELELLIREYDKNRFLGHMKKAELIAGNACETIPKFMEDHPHVVVSLLFLDFDLYEPTRCAIEHFLPRMPKGAVIAFDELDNPVWPGETQALVDTLGVCNVQIERIPWDPYIGFIRL